MKHAASALALSVALAGFAAGAGAQTVALKTTELGHGPAVVLVHSLGMGRMQWMPTARLLLADHRVVMVDLPGHGDSPMPESFSLDACADALGAVIARQPADSTIVVGQGLGGVLALRAVAAHPERQRGLIVIDTQIKSPIEIPDQQQQAFLQYLDTNYEQVMRPMFAMQARDSLQGVAMWAQASLVPPLVIKTYLRELLKSDASKEAKSLRLPLLFVATAKGWPADKTWAEASKRFGFDEIPAVSARRIGDSGGMVATDQPDSLAAIIRDFEARARAKK